MTIMGDDYETEGEGDEYSTVGAGRVLAPRRGGMLRLPPKPTWRREVAPGVSPPGEGLEQLPLTPDANSGLFTPTVTDIGFGARPQRPFRGERIIAIVSRSAGATGVIPIINPGIFVGTQLVGAELGDTPLEIFAPNAFGVRLSFFQATPGMLLNIPVRLRGTIPVGESIAVSVAIIGRTVR